MSIEKDKKQLNEFQESLKYKLVKVGDIVEEVHWITANPEELLMGVVVKVEKSTYNKVQWINFVDDRITIKWFKTGEIEKLPSCYIKIISNIPSD